MSKPTRKPVAPKPALRREEPPDGVDPIDLLPRYNARRKLVPETAAERLARMGAALEREVPVNDAHSEAFALARKFGVEVRVTFSTAGPTASLVLVP
jgi:hypothetical protein